MRINLIEITERRKMKKGIILTLIMLISLPGCGRKRSKKKSEPKKSAMAEKVDIFSSVNIPLAHDALNEEVTDVALDDTDVRSFFDEQIGEFESGEDLSIAMNDDAVEPEEDTQDSLEKFSWIEAATKEGDEEFKVVYFDWDSYKVGVEQKENVSYDVQQTKEELKVSQKTGIEPTVVIEGHACHSAGSPAYNLALSEKRAKKVADRFVDAGIDRDNIKIVGRGQEVPAVKNGEKVSGSREEQWLNRRVEVRVIYS